MVRYAFERYDRNKNGVFERDEWDGFRTFPGDADKNKDKKITRDEIGAWLASRYGGEGRGGSRRSGGDRGSESSKDSRSRSSSSGSSDSRGSYRLPTLDERLADLKLPKWFAQNDTNTDGQVVMSEFSRFWNDATVRDFAQFDLSGDGIITPQECARASEEGMVRGTVSESADEDSDDRVSSNSTRSEADSTANEESEAATTGDSEAKDIPKRYVTYAVGYIKKFDGDGDGQLVESEWKKMPRDYSAADIDKNGKITPLELARAMAKR